MIVSKAFHFVWISEMGAPQGIGAQGQALLSSYQSCLMPLPPSLVVTKWDDMREQGRYRNNKKLLDRHVNKRMKELQNSLSTEVYRTVAVKVQQVEQVETLISAMDNNWRLQRPLTIGQESLPSGAVLTWGFSEIQRKCQPPFTLLFKVNERSLPPLLFASNAAAVLHEQPQHPDEAARARPSNSVRLLWLAWAVLTSPTV